MVEIIALIIFGILLYPCLPLSSLSSLLITAPPELTPEVDMARF